MSKLTALSLILFTVAATPASATDVCIVKKSTDGFVALRAAPSAQGELISRAKAGQAVVIQKNESGDEIVQ